MTACTDAVVAQIRSDHRVAPTLQGQPRVEQRGETTVLTGSGMFAGTEASVTGRTSAQPGFTYMCELNLPRQVVTNVTVRVR